MSSENIYKFMHNLQIRNCNDGIDALTLTAIGIEGQEAIESIVESLKEEIKGERRKNWGYQGALGWSQGSVSAASKYTTGRVKKLWSILMVKGYLAEKALKNAINHENLNYTRVDIKTDLTLSHNTVRIPRRIKDNYKGKYPVTIIESKTGDTLYCGSRESGTFIRIYDKSQAYGHQAGSGTVWRFEVEFKNSNCRGVIKWLKDTDFKKPSDVIWNTLSSRDIPSPVIADVPDIRGEEVILSSAEMKLDWIGRQVRPTVKFLIALGLVDEVKEQLGLHNN